MLESILLRKIKGHYINKMINWISFNGNVKPTEGISDVRWAAMVKHIRREYLKE